MIETILVAIGGAVGAICRYHIGLLFTDSNFPYDINIVNLCGSFLMGLLYSVLDSKSYIRALILIGFLGALTTFSSFSMAIVRQTENRQLTTMTIFLTSNIFLSIGLCALGHYIGSKI
jgi:CrcB protein